MNQQLIEQIETTKKLKEIGKLSEFSKDPKNYIKLYSLSDKISFILTKFSEKPTNYKKLVIADEEKFFKFSFF